MLDPYQGAMSLQDQIRKGLLANAYGLMKPQKTYKDVLTNAYEKNLRKLAGNGVPLVNNMDPLSANQNREISGGSFDQARNVSGMIYDLALRTRDDNEFQAAMERMMPGYLERNPGVNVPKKGLKRDDYLKMSYTTLLQDKAYRDSLPKLKAYDAAPPPMPGQQGEGDKTAMLEKLLAADKGGNLKGYLPLLLKQAGILGGGDNKQFAGNPEAAIGVTQPDRAQNAMMGMNPLQAYMQGVDPMTGMGINAYSEDNLKTVKGMLDIQGLMNPKAEPIGALNPGQKYFDAQGRLIADGGEEAPQYGQPFDAIDPETMQPAMFVIDKQGNKKKIGAMPVPKKGLEIVSDGAGGFTFSQGGDAVDGYSALTKPTTNDLQKDLVSTIDSLGRIDQIGNKYADKYLTWFGQLRGLLGSNAEKLTNTKYDKGFVAGQTEFKNSVEQFFNQYRKEITGAAASVQELDRLKQSLLNSDMSPTQFQAAKKQFVELATRSMGIKQQLLSEGIPLNSEQFGKLMDQRLLGNNTSGQIETYNPETGRIE